jgi:hypothetical protein
MPGRAEERRPRAPPPPVGRAHLKWDPDLSGTHNVILIKSDRTEIPLKALWFRGDPEDEDIRQHPDCISISSMRIDFAKITGFMHGGRASLPTGIHFSFTNDEGALIYGHTDNPHDFDSIIKVGCPENRPVGGKRMKRKAKRSSKTRAKRSKARKSRRATRKA